MNETASTSTLPQLAAIFRGIKAGRHWCFGDAEYADLSGERFEDYKAFFAQLELTLHRDTRGFVFATADDDDYKGSKPKAPESTVEKQKQPLKDTYTAEELFERDVEDIEWIVDGLIAHGSQIIIAGPPKSGKSYLVTDIALALSRPFGSKEKERCLFASPPKKSPRRGNRSNKEEVDRPVENPFRVNRPKGSSGEEKNRGWKVLFISLEMGMALVRNRLKQQMNGYGLDTSDAKDLDLHASFGLVPENQKPGESLQQDLEIVSLRRLGREAPVTRNEGAHYKRLQEIFNALQPELVIYDSLIQLHHYEENDNILMKAVMSELRNVTRYENGTVQVPIAHIILHHTRKAKSDQWNSGGPSADGMRGAGSIHAAVDLAMTIQSSEYATESSDAGVARNASPATGSKKRVVLNVSVSSRASTVDNFCLSRTSDGIHQFQAQHLGEKKSADEKKKDAIRAALGVVGRQKAASHSDEIKKCIKAWIDGKKYKKKGPGYRIDLRSIGLRKIEELLPSVLKERVEIAGKKTPRLGSERRVAKKRIRKKN